jgi:hypothetical protein
MARMEASAIAALPARRRPATSVGNSLVGEGGLFLAITVTAMMVQVHALALPGTVVLNMHQFVKLAQIALTVAIVQTQVQPHNHLPQPQPRPQPLKPPPQLSQSILMQISNMGMPTAIRVRWELSRFVPLAIVQMLPLLLACLTSGKRTNKANQSVAMRSIAQTTSTPW